MIIIIIIYFNLIF